MKRMIFSTYLLLCCFLAFKVQGETRFTSPQPVDLTIVGPIKLNEGLGRIPADLIECLKDQLTMSFIPTTTYPEFLPELSLKAMQVVNNDGRQARGRSLVFTKTLSYPPRDDDTPSSFWTQYNLSEEDDGQIRFAYSMFESSRIPKKWVGILNRYFDAVLVPDEYLEKVYKSSGVKKPIFVLPLVLNLDVLLQLPLKKQNGDPFVFANMSACVPRKNLVKLVNAFGRVFKNNPHVVLKLSWRSFDPQTREDVLSAIASLKLTNVLVEEGAVPREEYVKKLSSIDCLINISTSEGFSNQPREAMACGIPVIITDNTAQRTISASGLVRRVPSDIEVPAIFHFPGTFGSSFQCKTKDVAKAMLDVYQNYGHYLNFGKKARSWVTKYNYPNLQILYRNVFKPKTILFGNKNSILKEGLMTNDRAFYDKLLRIHRSS